MLILDPELSLNQKVDQPSFGIVLKKEPIVFLSDFHEINIELRKLNYEPIRVTSKMNKNMLKDIQNEAKLLKELIFNPCKTIVIQR